MLHCQSSPALFTPALQATIALLSPSQRQRERERRTLPHLALHPDPPPVQFDELARQRQPEAGPLDLLRRRPHLPELLEHRLLILGGDAYSRVSHGDLSHPVLKSGPDVDPAG